jgi:transcriptional regulator with XRE-family HTH domain
LGDYFLFAICETASAMAPTLAPEVRLQFAKRLKALRSQRGYTRARYFAKSLGIEENRYTRYERAEVEPSLTLLHKMCQTLSVSPNELMGFGDLRHPRHFETIPGVAEGPAESASFGHDPEGGRGGGGKAPDPQGSLAWSLAAEAVSLRHEQAGRKAGSDPLETMEERVAVYHALQAEPFGTVTEIMRDRALKDVDAKRKTRLAELAQAFTDNVSQGTGRARRR